MNLILSDAGLKEVVNLLYGGHAGTEVQRLRGLLLSPLQRGHKFYRLVLEPATPDEQNQSFPSKLPQPVSVETDLPADSGSLSPGPTCDWPRFDRLAAWVETQSLVPRPLPVSEKTMDDLCNQILGPLQAVEQQEASYAAPAASDSQPHLQCPPAIT